MLTTVLCTTMTMQAGTRMERACMRAHLQALVLLHVDGAAKVPGLSDQIADHVCAPRIVCCDAAPLHSACICVPTFTATATPGTADSQAQGVLHCRLLLHREGGRLGHMHPRGMHTVRCNAQSNWHQICAYKRVCNTWCTSTTHILPLPKFCTASSAVCHPARQWYDKGRLQRLNQPAALSCDRERHARVCTPVRKHPHK